MSEVGRHLWRLFGPTPLLRQVHLEEVAQEHVQTAFKYFQVWRFHNLYEQPLLVLAHPTVKKQVDIQMDPSVFQFLPTAPGPVTRCH